jgi:hypothetical protein
MKDVRTVLQKAETQLTMLDTLYDADLDLQRTSPTLRFKIKAFLDSERSALDHLAAAIVASCGLGEGHIHYPLAAEAERFDESFDKNMPGVREKRPDLVAVVARHQPFSVQGLGDLRDLLRDEDRQKLTPQTQPAPPEPEPAPPPPAGPDAPAARPVPPPPSGGLGPGLTGPIFINGVEYDPITLKQINAPPPVKRDTIYVDWHFAGSETSARQTLQGIKAAVGAAIDEVAAAADLS